MASAKKTKGEPRQPEEVSDGAFRAFWDALQERVPYAQHIAEADARKWLAQVSSEAERGGQPVEWHIRRLGNRHGPLVGGSEIGVLLSAARKLPAPFGKTPGMLFDEKMLRRIVPSNIAMRFGAQREAQVAQKFSEQVGDRGWVRDTEGLSLLERHAQSGGFQTLAYSPDDLFRLPDGRRFLIDYKTPYSGTIPDKEPFSYVAQLHQGKIVLEEQCGLSVDGMLLVYGEHPDSLAHPQSLALHYFQVDFDPELAAEIPVVAQDFAQALMENRRPSVLEESVAERLKQLDLEYVLLMSQIGELQSRADAIKANMSEILASLPVADTTGAREETLSKPTIGFKSDHPDALMSLIQDVVPEVLEDEKTLSAWRKSGGLDLAKVQAYLEEQKVDLQPLSAPDTWDIGKIAKDPRIVASGVLDEALSRGVISRSVGWRVSRDAEEAAQRLALDRQSQALASDFADDPEWQDPADFDETLSPDGFLPQREESVVQSESLSDD